MENEMSLMQDIRIFVSTFKGNARYNLEESAAAFDRISNELGFATVDETHAFLAIFDRQCGDDSTDIEDIARYYRCTALDAMTYVQPINKLIANGFVYRDNLKDSLESKKSYRIYPEVFSAIVEGRKVKPMPVSQGHKFDQFDFCECVDGYIREREDRTIDSNMLFGKVLKLEEDNAALELVKTLCAIIPDIECRTLFYEMCRDFTLRCDGAESCISSTIQDIYDRIVDRARVKNSIIDRSNQLIQHAYIRQTREDAMALTNDGIRLLFGDKADAYIKKNTVEDRYEFVNRISDFVGDLPTHPDYSDLRRTFDQMIDLENENIKLTLPNRVMTFIEEPHSRLIFYLICDELVDGNPYYISNLGEVSNRSYEVRLKKSFKDGSHVLVKRGLVEVTGAGIYDGAQLVLTAKGKELFLEEDLDMFETNVAEKEIIRPDTIKEKHLYFDPSLERQLTMLTNSVSQDNYLELTHRLADRNLPKGVAVLLYGLPGTGKTESVMQLARATGRAVMHVDISATKTCWFGESEKLIKEVFTKYRRLCEKSRITPILLFNEADAVFSKRKDSNSSSVAQTENAIQNIILEEMETLDGILIATTNLADNLDKAFERRFLFKIRFDRPSVLAKRQIWLDKLPTLTVDEAEKLATRYDFSGGEIDNITRKAIMSEVIEGVAPTIDSLIILCDEERIGHQTTRVGF